MFLISKTLLWPAGSHCNTLKPLNHFYNILSKIKGTQRSLRKVEVNVVKDNHLSKRRMQTKYYLMRKLFICFRHSLRTCSLKSPSICAATCRFCSNIYRNETHIITGIKLVSKSTMVSKNLITLFGNYLLIKFNNSKKENKQKIFITLCFVRTDQELLKTCHWRRVW